MFGLNKKKIFTIIIPVYNGRRTIERTFASFISNKEYIKQVIVVDDCSTDNTKSVIDKWNKYKFFNILYKRNEVNSGPGFSRKVGIELSNSEWITFVDADDCLTNGCLKYVYNNIADNKDLVIVHSKSIYYESGDFNSESVGYSDTSCGGNFYRRKFLVSNNLYPHNTLPLVEDQYFNEKIMNYIEFCTERDKDIIGHFDYPVYEVHHDSDIEDSYAIRNWKEYCIDCRLLYKEYLVSDYIEIASENENKKFLNSLAIDYIRNYIFCFYLAVGLQFDNDINYEFNNENDRELFRNALLFYVEVFDKKPSDFTDYYNENNNIVNDIIDISYSVLGFEYTINYSFLDFIDSLL